MATLDEMDKAAEAAVKELESMDRAAVKLAAEWIRKHYKNAGYKRLCPGFLGIDVYEQEEKLFFRDLSDLIIRDDQIAQLMIFPNVMVTAHQGFFTRESLEEITKITLKNFDDFDSQSDSDNEVSCKLIKDCSGLSFHNKTISGEGGQLITFFQEVWF